MNGAAIISKVATKIKNSGYRDLDLDFRLRDGRGRTLEFNPEGSDRPSLRVRWSFSHERPPGASPFRYRWNSERGGPPALTRGSSHLEIGAQPKFIQGGLRLLDPLR